MKKRTDQSKRKIQTITVFVITFFIVIVCAYMINQNQVKEEKLQAAYTAESTINRVESQLNKYLTESQLIKRIIEENGSMDDDEFASISKYMQDSQNVIEAHELAKDGTVSQIYPLEGNEEAIGLNMLQNPARKKEANLAKESGQYTIAGPYELVQGGVGTLLFDPVYTKGTDGKKQFWGFSILVLNWQKFMDEIQLNKLEEAGYQYQIWKKDPASGKQIVIAQSEKKLSADTLEVACAVPNEIWYFEIVPSDGWVSWPQRVFGFLIALGVAVTMAVGVWQFQLRQYKDQIHAQEIEKSAKIAKQANEAKTRFLFNMSHDIRTPMNAIIGFSELLEKHTDDPEKVRDYIAKIKSSSSLLLSLINYVLEMARIESGKATLKEEIGDLRVLSDTFSAVFEPTVREKELSYNCELDIEHFYVTCDKTKVREILINIISNSVKYTPRGGKVQVTVTEEEVQKEGYASYRFVVEDTGIGMSEEYLPHIFEEFTREHTTTESKVVGTGLGLPIVKALVDLMGGTIDVESKVGKGTKFTLVLPFRTATAEQFQEEQKQRKAKNLQALEGKRILLAEDNKLNAEITMTILQESGFKVEHAEDGVICLQKVKEKPEDYYDVILMDIQMPNMDGYQTTKEIRKLKGQRATVPIIAMTANAFEEDRKKAFDSGMDGYIAKPMTIDALFTTLEEILHL